MDPLTEILTRLDRLEAQLKPKPQSKWMTQEEAMAEIGCKETKMRQLRDGQDIVWRRAGKGIMVLRSSVEKYCNKCALI